MDNYDDYEDFVIEADYEDFGDEELEEDFDIEEELLESMIEDHDESDVEDLADFFGKRARKRRQARRARRRGRGGRRKPAPRAARPKPAASNAKIKEIEKNISRNAAGIRQLDSKVSTNASITSMHRRQIGKINKTQKAVGVLEFVQAYDPNTKQLNTFQLLKGAVASGMLGSGKGTMHNPYLLGVAGLILQNNNGDLGNLFGGGS